MKELLLPHTGTLIWMFLAFSTVFFILKKFAWKPILNALKTREDSITDALQSAELARGEMQKLQSDNEKIITDAKLERDSIIKEARELKNDIVEEAKNKAAVEADKVIENAKKAIKNERKAAIDEIKQQVALLSVDIAEKILQEKLAVDANQQEMIDKYLRQIKLN